MGCNKRGRDKQPLWLPVCAGLSDHGDGCAASVVPWLWQTKRKMLVQELRLGLLVLRGRGELWEHLHR